jgi:hypothetical protein
MKTTMGSNVKPQAIAWPSETVRAWPAEVIAEGEVAGIASAPCSARSAYGLDDIVAQSVDKTILVYAVEPGFGRFIVALRVGEGDLRFAGITLVSDAEAEASQREVIAAPARVRAQEVRQHPETAEVFEDAARAVFRERSGHDLSGHGAVV